VEVPLLACQFGLDRGMGQDLQLTFSGSSSQTPITLST